MQKGDAADRTELLGDFHVRMAELMGNEVLAQMLGDSRRKAPLELLRRYPLELENFTALRPLQGALFPVADRAA